MDLGLGLDIETAAKLGIPAGSAVLGYLERRKIKASIEKLRTAQTEKKDRRRAEKELAEAKKKEIKDLVLAFTGGVGELTTGLIEMDETAHRSPKDVLEEEGVMDVEDGDDAKPIDPSACPKCGASVEKEYRACPSCATKLRQECPGCHELSPVSFRSCPKCGRAFSKLWDPMADVRD